MTGEPMPDTALDRVRCTVEGTTATVRLNRPDKRNAMTIQMWREVAEVCAGLADNPTVRAVLVTGEGASFCSGADISALTESDETLKAAVGAAEHALRTLPVPTIAAIRGHCWGGGMQIAIACDLRVATEGATFAVPPARLGVVYPAESLRGMLALVGPALTKRMIFSGDPIGAQEALRVGLLDRMVAEADLDGAVQDLVSAFAPRSLLSQSAAKAVLNALVAGADPAPVYERFQDEWAGSVDGREGPAAFLAKRAAEYSWHPSTMAPAPGQGRSAQQPPLSSATTPPERYPR